MRRFSFVLAAIALLCFYQLAGAQDPGEALSQPMNIENWMFILGALNPIVLSFILQSGWGRSTQAAIAFIWCVVTTGIGQWLSGELIASADFVSAILVVFATSITAYYGFWKPTGISPTIENKTSLPAS